ncbi:MAG: LytTR family DNA-binding domain-containing protein [Bacteroidota bacterium]
MKVVVVEDEHLSAERLCKLLKQLSKEIEVVAHLDSVQSTLHWLKEHPKIDLIFLDIQLSDGVAFDILSEMEQSIPIIFTTAYDEYAVKAFKFKSIDYLLKPIDKEELENALSKYGEWYQENDQEELERILKKDYKKRFLVKIGEQYQRVESNDICFFYFDSGITYIKSKEGKRLPIDFSLEQLEQMINPLEFFRVNRKYIICISGISQIHTYFNSRLLLKMHQDTPDEVIVSRDRVNSFKKWIDC